MAARHYDGVLEGTGFHPGRYTGSYVENIFKMYSLALSEIEDDTKLHVAKDVFLAKTGRKGRSK